MADIFESSIDFINLDGDDLGPPPDVGPSPIVLPNTMLVGDDDFDDDLGSPPTMGPSSIIIPSIQQQAAAVSSLNDDNIVFDDSITPSMEVSEASSKTSWHCVESFDVKWDEDDFSGNIKSANEYKVLNSLGSGSFASVYQVFKLLIFME